MWKGIFFLWIQYVGFSDTFGDWKNIKKIIIYIINLAHKENGIECNRGIMGKLIYFIVVGSLLNQLMIYWGKFICEFKKKYWWKCSGSAIFSMMSFLDAEGRLRGRLNEKITKIKCKNLLENEKPSFWVAEAWNESISPQKPSSKQPSVTQSTFK